MVEIGPSAPVKVLVFGSPVKIESQRIVFSEKTVPQEQSCKYGSVAGPRAVDF